MQAYDEGYDAARWDDHECPYPEGTIQWLEWRRGWHDARESWWQRKKSERESKKRIQGMYEWESNRRKCHRCGQKRICDPYYDGQLYNPINLCAECRGKIPDNGD